MKNVFKNSFLLLLVLFCINTTSQAQPYSAISKGLIAHYPFDKDARDLTGNANHGEIKGATLESSICSNGYYFDGVDDYIDFGNKPVLNQISAGITLSFWVKPMNTKPEDLQMIIGKWGFNAPDDHFGIFLSVRNKIAFSVGDGTSIDYGTYSNEALDPHKWYHVIATWNRASKMVVLFINGELDQVERAHCSAINKQSPISFKAGRQIVRKDRPFHGMIDEVRLYKRALNIEEMRNLFFTEIMACKRVTLKGKVLDAKTKEPIGGAKIQFKDLTTGKIYSRMLAEAGTGNYQIDMPIGFSFGVMAQSKDYITKKVPFYTHDFNHQEVVTRDILLNPIDTGGNDKILISGRVLDELKQTPVQAEISFMDLASDEEIIKVYSNPQTGEYSAELPIGYNYGYFAKAKNYISINENLNTEGMTGVNTIKKDIYLVKLEVGVTVRLNNIFFDTGKASLREESFGELNRLKKILLDFPKVKIEIAGHTDNVGSDSYNLKLSQQRANSVRHYLVYQGVLPDRIIAKGYGESVPVSDNNTDEGRQLNRRVEFKVLER